MAKAKKAGKDVKPQGKAIINGQQFVRKVGQSLLTQRKRLGFSQAEVAEKIGIEPESVSRIENGVIAPTLARLEQFGKVYGCSLSDLLSEASSLPRDLENRLASALTQLHEADRAFVTEHAIALARHLGSARQGTQTKKASK